MELFIWNIPFNTKLAFGIKCMSNAFKCFAPLGHFISTNTSAQVSERSGSRAGSRWDHGRRSRRGWGDRLCGERAEARTDPLVQRTQPNSDSGDVPILRQFLSVLTLLSYCFWQAFPHTVDTRCLKIYQVPSAPQLTAAVSLLF